MEFPALVYWRSVQHASKILAVPHAIGWGQGRGETEGAQP